MLVLWVGWILRSPAQGFDSGASLVINQAGALPVILSAPHGGRSPIPGVPERQGRGVAQFVTTYDGGTAELAESLAVAIERQFGKRPYVVIARFDRHFVDANRPAREAYETPVAQPIYAAYHEALAAAVHDIRQTWGQGILLDLHGQGADAETIFRGTQNGRSVAALVQRFGTTAIDGSASLLGSMADLGYTIFPPSSGRREDPRFNGGYIIQTYGSDRPDGVDAFQLEFGSTWRSIAHRDQVASDLAKSLARFGKAYGLL